MKKFRVTLWARGGQTRYPPPNEVSFFRDVNEGGEEIEIPHGILQAITEQVYYGAKFTITIHPIQEHSDA